MFVDSILRTLDDFGIFMIRLRRLYARLHERSVLLVVGILMVLLLSALIRVSPYIFNDFQFEIGYDTGVYERVLDYYEHSGTWGSLPAYPDFPSSYSAQTKWLEPGFFVVTSAANSIIGADVHWLFRFYVPSLAGISLVLVSFVAGRGLTHRYSGGLFAASLVAVSYVQVWAVDESYYRQIFASVLLILSLVYLDRYIAAKEKRYLFASTLLASGTVAFHIAVSLLAGLVLTFVLLYFLITKERRYARHVEFSIAGFAALSMPSWVPRLGDISSTFITALMESSWRVSTLFNGQGRLEGGGSIPGIFWSFPHILIGYVIVFCPVVILSVVGYFALSKKKELHYSIPVLSLILWVYVGIWLFFGNRFLLNLDLLLCIIAPVGLFFLFKSVSNERKRQLGILLVASVVFGANLTIVSFFQEQNTPYITDNPEGVLWIESNIPINDSAIFAPDYLSSNLIQMGYLTAVWDYSLYGAGSKPVIISDNFLLEAPVNDSFLREFFSDNPSYSQKGIYVMWGSEALETPLTYGKEKIPVQQYFTSRLFELRYVGYGDILNIYKYVGTR